ncbi:MAG: hypothetical protein E7311_06790 [Clostridiales bacterium]|nr:hypothetical protein [Clostridiales bacterium]
MISNKNINKIVLVIVAIGTILCILGVIFADKILESFTSVAVNMEYEEKIFNTEEIIDINIIIDEADWQDLLNNAISEEYYSCNVVINNETYSNVGIRAKGNTSLSTIANDTETDRYSLKIEFDQYVDGQSLYGLDKLILNNNYADATNMKEAIVYDMFEYLDAEASLYNYAKIYVNGEYWGVYLALEAVEESFAIRNYGVGYGELYKPDSMEMGGGNRENGDNKNFEDMLENIPEEMFQNMKDNMPQGMEINNPNSFPDEADATQDSGKTNFQQGMGRGQNMTPPNNMNENIQQENFNIQEIPDIPEGMEEFEMPENMVGKGMMGGFGGGSAASLNYIDDELDSYSIIWESSIFESSDTDHKRVVTALKNISENNNIEQYMDVDAVLKYLAVHTFVVNLDSLSGNMTHNYYLYEDDGKLSLVPWDYNLAFGGFSMGGRSQNSESQGSATSTINFAIDTPFSQGISNEDRKFFATLLDNEEYLAKYHEYLNKLVEEYVYAGKFEETYNRIRGQIDELVKTDNTAFYTYDEYEKAAEILKQVVNLRAQSVEGQLNGNIPSTTDGQNQNSNLLIKSDINLSDMGTMNMGGGAFQEQNIKRNKWSREENAENIQEATELPQRENLNELGKSNMPDMRNNQKSMNNTNTINNLIIYAVCLGAIILTFVVIKFSKR